MEYLDFNEATSPLGYDVKEFKDGTCNVKTNDMKYVFLYSLSNDI